MLALNVGDGSTGLGGTKAGVGNLAGDDRQVRRLCGREIDRTLSLLPRDIPEKIDDST